MRGPIGFIVVFIFNIWFQKVNDFLIFLNWSIFVVILLFHTGQYLWFFLLNLFILSIFWFFVVLRYSL